MASTQRSPVVSGTQVSIGGNTYDVNDITSVSMVRPVLTRALGWGVAVLGAIILVLGYIVWGTFLTPMLAGIVLLIAGVVVALVVRESYTVRLNRASGDPELIQFQDSRQAEQVVTEIGAAIARHRPASETPLEREVGQ